MLILGNITYNAVIVRPVYFDYLPVSFMNCIIRKTKRATLPERMVQKSKRNVRRKQNEAYHWCAFLCPCKVGGDLKIFRPGFAGVCGAVPGAPPPRSAIVFERPPNIVRRPFFLCSRFSLWVAARPLSLMLLRLSPCTRQRSAP